MVGREETHPAGFANGVWLGKTIVFSSVTKEQVNKGHRVLIMAHRSELLEQASNKLKEASGLDSALEKAESASLGSPFPVTVGSVQSLCQEKRLSQFPDDYFQDIVVDEAHHCLSESYQRVLEHFSKANVLGVTATPDRADKKSLGEYFDSVAYEYTMLQAVQEGYLCPIKAQTVPLELDLTGVSMQNGDFSAGESGSAIEPYLEQIATRMEQFCADRKTVVFLPLVEMSKKFRDILCTHGFKAAEVNGNSKDRAQTLRDFENGNYNVLCNAMLLTEGWDCPSVDCVIMLRPTKRRSFYQQVVGRGTRPAEGKKDLLILDFLWLTERHDLCRPADLISPSAEISQMINEKMQSTPEGIDLLEAKAQAEKIIIERERSLMKRLESVSRRKGRLIDPLQFALSICAEDLVNYTPMFRWQSRPATEKQLGYLEHKGIDIESIADRGRASVLIDRLKQQEKLGLTTPRQIRTLEGLGFIDVGSWKFEKARQWISVISQNGWEVPKNIDPKMFDQSKENTQHKHKRDNAER